MGAKNQLNLDFGDKFNILPDKEKWEIISHYLISQDPGSSRDLWLSQLRPVSLGTDKFIFTVSASFTKEWIEKHYLDLLEKTAERFTGHPVKVEINVVPTNNLRERKRIKKKRKPAFGLSLNENYTFDNFVVGQSNRLAYAAAKDVAEKPGRKNYNPLFIHGGVGLGKTHLLQAVGNALLANSEMEVVYVPAEYFTFDYVEALKSGQMSLFRSRYRNIDVWLVDDIQFIADKERTTEEFFHTFNALYETGKQIIICSDRPPEDLDTLHRRIVSRLKNGPIMGISPPDLELRLAILQKKAEQEKANIPPEILLYIAREIKSNIRDLEGALAKLIAWSSINDAQLTLPLAEELLVDYIARKPKAITIDEVINTVCKYFNITQRTLKGKRKDRKVSLPRQICMYLCRELTSASVTDIARALGKTHPAVISNYNKIKEEMARDQELTKLIQKITSMLLPSSSE
ncbi:chromosomal replication initiator protein DnaA [bacterium]|nr:chromosomal replication initiator protein DnaA [bacterium]